MLSAVLLSGCARALTPAMAVLGPQVAAQPLPAEVAPAPETGPDGLLTVEAFAARLAEALERQAVGWSIQAEEGAIIQAWRDDVAGPGIPVGPAYARYRSEPEEIDRIIAAAVSESLWLYQAAPTWEEARLRLYPRLISVEEFNRLADSGAMPVHVPISNEVDLVFDLKVEGISYLVHESMQLRWGRSASEFFRQATTNLGEVTPPLQRGPEGVWSFPVADGYQAERVLLVNRLAEVDWLISGRLVIAIPARDRLYAFDGTNTELAARMRERTDREFAHDPHRLTKLWLNLVDGQLSIHESPGD